MAPVPALLSIGELARRTGLSVSAIRFYESRGLVMAVRTAGNQRRLPRSDIRRLSFAVIAQQLGMSLAEIEAELAALPQGRTPTREDWERMSRAWAAGLDRRIAALLRLRQNLAGCIGCGCLSIDRCAIFNQDDHLGAGGRGPVLLRP